MAAAMQPSPNDAKPLQGNANPVLKDIRFKDLETRGFVHIPGYLAGSELQDYVEDFRAQTPDRTKMYAYVPGSAGASARAAERAHEVLDLVRQQTDLQVDLPQQVWYFKTGKTGGIKYGWHQDNESLWQTQNHYDYLNFYIPVKKERLEKSNLTVIPFDVLKREMPVMHRRLYRNGASHFVHIWGQLVHYQFDTGSMHVVRKDLERISETPFLAPGDLLLVRGDTLHKTQDADTERIAMSFRVSSSRTMVTRKELAVGGLNKVRAMAKNPGPYHKMLLAFESAGRDQLPYGELTRLVEQITAPAPSPGDFAKRLMLEKLRQGKLTQFTTATALTLLRRSLNWKG